MPNKSRKTLRVLLFSAEVVRKLKFPNNSIEKRFRDSRKQGENAFLKVDNPALSRRDVLAKIRAALRDKAYRGGTDGQVIVHLSATGETFHWALAELAKK